VIASFYGLSYYIRIREFDMAYAWDYIANSLKGFLIGGVIFLLLRTGLLVAPVSNPDVSGSYVLFLVAVLAGFKQDYVLEFLRGLMAAIFRTVPTLGGASKTESKT
jgi:hypothetical protein